MSRVMILGVLLLCGCKSTNDVRALRPVSEATSSKGVEAVAGCFALKFAQQRGVEVRSENISGGISVAQKVRVAGLATTMAVVDVIQQGNGVSATLKAVGGKPLPGAVFNDDLRECL